MSETIRLRSDEVHLVLESLLCTGNREKKDVAEKIEEQTGIERGLL